MAEKNNNTPEKKNKFAETRENFVNAVIESLEKGKIPWQKTWDADCGNNLLYNPVTGTRYKGVNNIMLIYSSYAKGYEDNRWVTFNQAKENGWSVRKGEKGTPIEIFKFYDKSTKKDLDMTMYNSLSPAEKVEYFTKNVYIVAKNYTVFNAQQVEGIPPVEKKGVKNIDYNKIDKIMENCGVPITHKGSSAFYSPSTDQIFLPEREAFHSENDYYATALHEIAHSTGHPSRLNRDLSGKFGSKSYATEELKAEFASVFIGQEKGLNYNFENNIAYIQSWAEVIKNNHEVLFSAIKEASKITEMVLGYEKGKVLSKELTKGKDKGNEVEI